MISNVIRRSVVLFNKNRSNVLHKYKQRYNLPFMNIPLQVSKFSSSASKKDEDQTPIEDASSTKASAANTVDDNANDDDKKDSVETKGSEDEKIEETEDLSAKYKEQAAQYMNDIKNIDPKKLMNRAYTKILDLIDYGKEEMAEAYKELMDEDKKNCIKT